MGRYLRQASMSRLLNGRSFPADALARAEPKRRPSDASVGELQNPASVDSAVSLFVELKAIALLTSQVRAALDAVCDLLRPARLLAAFITATRQP